MTLLEQLDRAEAALRQHVQTRPASAFYPGQQPGDTLRRQAHVDAEHTARTNALSALCAAAAARCLVAVEDISDGPVMDTRMHFSDGSTIPGQTTIDDALA